MQYKVLAWHREIGFQYFHDPAAGISFYLLVANLTQQICLVVLLDTNLAHMVDPGVSNRVKPTCIVFINATDGTDGMHHQLTLGVPAHQARLDLDARQPVTVDADTGDLFLAQAEPQRHGFKRALAALDALLKCIDITRLQLQYRIQGRESRFHIVNPLGCQGQVKGW